MTQEEDIWYQHALDWSMHLVREGKEPLDAVGEACLRFNLPEYFTEEHWDEWVTHCEMYEEFLRPFNCPRTRSGETP